MTHRSVRIPSTVALVVSACANPDATRIPPMALDSVDYELGSATRTLIAGADDDHLAIARTFDATLDGQTFLLADFENDRVLRLDTMFTLLESFGRSGSGPGELRGPRKAIARSDLLAVSDWNNSRIAFFHRGGEYLRAVTIRRKPDSFAVRSDGSVVTSSALRTHYAERTGEQGTVTPFAERPPGLRADPGVRTLGGSGSLLLLGTGDTTHVFDNEWGVLLKFAPDGTLVLARSLPIDLLKELLAFRTDLVRSLRRRGHRVVAAPLVTSMAFAEHGRIVIMIGVGRTLVLTVDPSDYSARRVTARLETLEFALARDAVVALPLGRNLYVFSSAGLASFPLRLTAR